jgi:hypothetical protein
VRTFCQIPDVAVCTVLVLLMIAELCSGLLPGTCAIDVFDTSGVYLGTLPPEFPMPLEFMPDGKLLLVERDELDIERLVVARVSVRGDTSLLNTR